MVYPEGPNKPDPAGSGKHSPASPARIVVLVSGSGTNLQALIDAVATDPAYGAQIVAVGADRTICQGLERAEKAGIPTFALRVKDFASGEHGQSASGEHGQSAPGQHGQSASGERGQSEARADWDKAIRDEVAKYEPDLVVSPRHLERESRYPT